MISLDAIIGSSQDYKINFSEPFKMPRSQNKGEIENLTELGDQDIDSGAQDCDLRPFASDVCNVTTEYSLAIFGIPCPMCASWQPLPSWSHSHVFVSTSVHVQILFL